MWTKNVENVTKLRSFCVAMSQRSWRFVVCPSPSPHSLKFSLLLLEGCNSDTVRGTGGQYFLDSWGTQFKFVTFTMELGNFLLKVKTFAFLKEISTHALNAQQCPCYALYAMFSTVSFVGWYHRHYIQSSYH